MKKAIITILFLIVCVNAYAADWNDGRLGYTKIWDGTETLGIDADGKIGVTLDAQIESNVTISSPLSEQNMNTSVTVCLAKDHYDEITRAITVVDYNQHEMHTGNHYYIEGHVALNDTQELSVSLVTADTAKWAHFVWDIQSSGILETDLYEDVTASGGVTVVPINNNRNSTNTSGITIKSGATLDISDATNISNSKVGGTGFKTVTGGSMGRDDELILKQNTQYGRVFRSGSDDNVIHFKAMWYEHTSKQNT